MTQLYYRLCYLTIIHLNIKDTSSSTIIFTIAIGIIILLFAGIITFQNTEAIQEEEETSYKNSNNNPLSALFKQVQQSVVQISSSEENIDNNQLGFRLGSGFIYDKNGHIITDYHVVNEGNKFLVTFPDGSIYNGEIVGLDPYSDLAVIKVNAVPQEKLKPLVFGNSLNLVIGQHVAAVGNPFGLLGSMTEGIVSGLGRLLPSIIVEPLFGSEIVVVVSFSIPDTIQTDAAINPGNSGGPLLNMKGEVIGINSAIFSNTGVYSGVGFAIPSNTAKKVVPALIEKGSYDHPWLGIIGIDITPTIAEVMNLTEAKGFLVTHVRANSPADKAGIKGGDIIVTINNNSRKIELGGDIIIGIDGKPVRKIDDILTYIAREKLVGDQVTFTLIRNGETLEEKNLTLEKRPDSENIFKIGK